MGIDIIQLGDQQALQGPITDPQDLAQLAFHDYTAPSPQMFIWLMLAMKDKRLFPWWTYDQKIDHDIQTLNEIWNISTPQGLFDCLFLSTLKRFAGSNFFAILPGNIKADGWTRLRESDRTTFLRGQGCVYHLQGAFDNRLTINWVPFWQPQSLVRDPAFSNLWRLHMASRGEDVTSSISFFSLSEPNRLAKVVNLLIDQDDLRSEKLSELVDWFGLYTTPLDDRYSPTCVLYAHEKETINRFATLQQGFSTLFEDVQKQLLQNPTPSTVIRLLTRHIPL